MALHTVDVSDIQLSPVEGTVVNIPSFTTGLINIPNGGWEWEWDFRTINSIIKFWTLSKSVQVVYMGVEPKIPKSSIKN